MSIRRIVDVRWVQVRWTELFWGAVDSLDIVNNTLLVVISYGLQIGVEDFHVFCEKDLAVVHSDDGFVTADLDDDAALVIPKGDDVGVLWGNTAAPAHAQVVF